MKKVGICGHFGGNKVYLDGQTVKTKIITEELRNQLGKEEVQILDTYGGAKNIFAQLKGLVLMIKKCENIIILPAHNSLRIFVPFLNAFNIFKKRKLHYVVIGGWLPKFIKKRRILTICLKRFDYIYVETTTMKRAMEEQKFNNIKLMPNCKKLRVLKKSELIYNDEIPYKLCTFSRVMKEKGILDAINAVKHINTVNNFVVYRLDIYGQIDENFEKEFKAIQEELPPYISYKGVAPYNETVDILKSYFALLFPTHYFTEGIPGTIIDAYAAGIPVIASRWESFSDVVDENSVGIGYQFSSYADLLVVLEGVHKNPKTLTLMKENCLKKSKEYAVENVVRDKILL